VNVKVAASGLLIVALAAAPALAQPSDTSLVESVVFARGESLWRVDTEGKTKAIEIARLGLPAKDVTTIRSDRSGRVLLLEIAGGWHWVELAPPVTEGATDDADDAEAAAEAAAAPELPAILPLACAPGPASLAADGDVVVCAGDDGTPVLHRLRPLQRTSKRSIPGRDITFLDSFTRELVLATDDGVWAQSIRRPREQRKLVPEAPLRSFLPSPDGRRALGVYRETIGGKGKDAGQEREALVTFALDGRGIRRPHIRNGTPLMWSWDSKWALVQEARRNGVTAGCLARGVGGEYKCWKGYVAVGISPDGSYALLLGSASNAEDGGSDAGEGAGEDDGDDDDDDDDREAGGEGAAAGASANPFAVPLPKGPLSLYRGKLAGAYTEAPKRIERKVDGAAVWIPLPPPPPAAPHLTPARGLSDQPDAPAPTPP
jgi:hypothetical protein